MTDGKMDTVEEVERRPLLNRKQGMAAGVALFGAAVLFYGGWAGPKLIQMRKQALSAAKAAAANSPLEAQGLSSPRRGLFFQAMREHEPFLFEHNVFLQRQLQQLPPTSISRQNFSNELPPNFNTAFYAFKALAIATTAVLATYSAAITALVYRYDARSPQELATGIEKDMKKVFGGLGLGERALTEEDKNVQKNLEELFSTNNSNSKP